MKKPRATEQTPRALHLRHTIALLDEILDGARPADKIMESYFRANPKLGGRDRGVLAETAYACLRQRRVLAYFATGEVEGWAAVTAELLVAAAFVGLRGWSARSLSDLGYRGDAMALAERARSYDSAALPLAVRCNLPDALAERLVAQLGEAETEALAAALNEPAPLDMRVNTLKTDRASVQQKLSTEGFDCTPTPYSPLGLRRLERAPLFQTTSFRAGEFEVQDEGSQLISFLVEPRRREAIADYCAGGGGKTLQLAAMMDNTGTVYALDIAAWRLERLKGRVVRAGLDNVRIIAITGGDDPRLQRLAGKLDRVLVDAPCSGTGTLRRSPDIKWRSVDIAALTVQQGEILDDAARLVKPGGRLVYATCSLLAEENEQVVAAFVQRNSEFQIVPIAPILARREIFIANAEQNATLHLYPHRHGTDGFFAAVLERAKS